MHKLPLISLLTGSLLIASGAAFANSFDSYPMDNGPYMGVSGGFAIFAGGKTHTISYNMPGPATEVDSYHDNDKTNYSGTVGLHFGYALRNLSYDNELSFGLGIYNNTGLRGEGQVISSINGGPAFHYFNYAYNLREWRVMAEVTAAHRFGYFFPFVTLGVGPSFINSHNYRETAVQNPSPVDHAKPFKDGSDTRIAYQLGAGIGYYFNLNDTLSLSYRHVAMGDISFGGRDAKNYPYSLDLGKIKTNEFVLTYTHIFAN